MDLETTEDLDSEDLRLEIKDLEEVSTMADSTMDAAQAMVCLGDFLAKP